MGIIAWLIFGLIAGALAKLIVPGDDPGGGGFRGLIVTIAIGIVGAMIGGFIGTAIGWGTVGSFDFRSMALAVVGGVIFLLVLRAATGRRTA
ncbi:MAG: GlsB/YeaQ/YmgE family stress response membrane protein [Tepidiforma sp.]